MPPEKIKSGIQREADAVLQTILSKVSPDIHKMPMLKKILQSPEYWEHPVLSRIVRLFVRDRNELYHQYFEYLNSLDDPKEIDNTIQEWRPS